MFGPFLLPKHIEGLETAYRDGGVPALHKEHLALTSKSRSYRIVLKLVDLVFPVSVAFELAGRFDEQVKEYGLHEAANALLNSPAIPWETVLPKHGWHKVMTSPTVIYCNHPSLITPFFMAAALDRPDLKMIGAGYVQELGPHMAAHMFPFQRARRTSMAGDSGIATTAVASWLLDFLYPYHELNAARAHNRRMLVAAARYVQGGGAVLIAPQGGHGDDQKWFPGIGRLISELGRGSGAGTVQLVPARIENSSNTRIRHLVSRNRSSRQQSKRPTDPPIRVVFAAPIPLESLVQEQDTDARRITAILEDHYRTLFDVFPDGFQPARLN